VRPAERVSDAPMDLVLQAPDLSPEAIDAFRRRFPAAPIRRQTASVRLVGVDLAPELAHEVAELAARWRCDATLVSPRMVLSEFRVLALDMDSTLIRIECIDELARLAGLGPEVAAITEAAMARADRRLLGKPAPARGAAGRSGRVAAAGGCAATAVVARSRTPASG